MTAHTTTSTRLLDAAAAHARAAARALRAAPVGPIGLELEFFLVAEDDPRRAVTWPELAALLEGVPALPGGSSLSAEPGGQVELSTPPAPDVASAIEALQADRAVLARAAAAAGFGLASVGADPARLSCRVSPASRYLAMEQHFAARGCPGPAQMMMCSTAALQVNVNAGDRHEWALRLARLQRLTPVLTAISACSPMIAGTTTGWASMRQQAWAGIDPARTDAVPWAEDPAREWADYALAAPVMLTRDEDGIASAVGAEVSFAQWANGNSPIGYRPSVADLDYHVTTLFPPVRARGYIELRCLDAVPARWWPGLVVIVATLLDDPQAAAEADAVCSALICGQQAAARDGLRDREVHRAAVRCVQIAQRYCPASLRGRVAEYAELIGRSRTPGDTLREVIRTRGPLAALVAAVDA